MRSAISPSPFPVPGGTEAERTGHQAPGAGPGVEAPARAGVSKAALRALAVVRPLTAKDVRLRVYQSW